MQNINDNIINIADFLHLKKTAKPITRYSQYQQEELAYIIMIRATGLTDFYEKADFYHKYATEFCFAHGLEVRDINIERRLRQSNPALQMPY
ncbi:hypothetical protein [Shewanella sp. 4_MG-2023]|uniref:hypothetical protein n=1 Tax=Shewanella sp. 4_MG-2023 TaxID=3062652 RepID=UPI0026E29F76|nr:hypothetical protein [Shewanella sp. 4_MG-2023]MDO6677081.1 hypothetical protein [Shewanella sp. 4_MG-2023]